MKQLFIVILIVINLCLLYGYSGLHKEMSATRAEAVQLRQEAVATSVELVKAQAEARRAADRVDAVYSQVKELRWVVEGPQKGAVK